jgi:enediyne biosynthesis protein E4
MVVDFNLDGLLDLVVVNRGSNAQVWRNTTKAAGHWLQVKLEQAGPNRDGIGAWIEVKRGNVITRREITSGGGHASGHLGWRHFGLANAEAADIRVLWPDGVQGPWQTVFADRFYKLKRGADAELWQPK